MSTDLVEDMCDLFRGRLDAYGTDEGGCDRVDPPRCGCDVGFGGQSKGVRHVADCGRPAPPFDYEQEYRRRMTAHLVGASPFGVYPLVHHPNSPESTSLAPEWLTRWGCTDLDNVTSPAAARNIARLLHHWGLNAWVEVSRSKGFHVWSFSYEWVPAETMRNTFLAAHQVLGIAAKEVNPKQVSLKGEQLGNYVRVPYPGAYWTEDELPDTKRQCVYDIDTGQPIGLTQWVGAALHTRSSPLQYEKASSRYKAPPPREPVEVNPGVGNRPVWAIAQELNKEGFCAWKYGPKEGYDRSSSLARLAHNCRESDLTTGEAFAILLDADNRWGKFSERPDQEEQLMKMIERAYGRVRAG